jgi:hypothetical protein
MSTFAPPQLDRDVLRVAIRDVFARAPQQSSAAQFGTVGINFRAGKP